MKQVASRLGVHGMRLAPGRGRPRLSEALHYGQILGGVAAGGVFVVLLLAGPAWSLDLSVDSQVDDTDAVPGDGVCQSGTGACALRAAVQEANAYPGFDTVHLATGIYALTLGGEGEDAAAGGDLDVTDGLAVVGSRADAVAIDGNGIDRVFHVHPGNELMLSDLTIARGLVTSSYYGGGILNQGGTLTIERCQVEGNRADGGGFIGFGGGIANQSNGTLVMRESALIGNSAGAPPGPLYELGGGLSHESGTATLTNVTVGQNYSGNLAGGIYCGSATLNLRNVTIAGNEASEAGGGLGTGTTATVNIRNSIISDNFAAGGDDDCLGTVTSGGYNLIETPGCTIAGDPTGVQIGLSAQLDGLGGNGGGTDTYPVSPPSPAVSAGNPAPPGSDGPACDARDQRGFPRVLSAPCDLGAFENGPCSPEPRGGCRMVTQQDRSFLMLRDDQNDSRDTLKWRWSKGQATADYEFGDGTTDYAFCVYDDTGLVLQASVPGSAICGGETCWTDLSRGLEYKDRAGSSDGVTKIRGREGLADGLAKLLVTGKGINLDYLSPPWGGEVTAQAEVKGFGTCWTASFDVPIQNSDILYRAKGQ